jgi:hypothetical protein
MGSMSSFYNRYGGPCAQCRVARDYHQSSTDQAWTGHPFVPAIRCWECGFHAGYHADDCYSMGAPRVDGGRQGELDALTQTMQDDFADDLYHSHIDGARQAELDIARDRRAYDARIARARIERGIADRGDREAIAREIEFDEREFDPEQEYWAGTYYESEENR